jgi:lysophospholipase L1-like esterase
MTDPLTLAAVALLPTPAAPQFPVSAVAAPAAVVQSETKFAAAAEAIEQRLHHPKATAADSIRPEAERQTGRIEMSRSRLTSLQSNSVDRAISPIASPAMPPVQPSPHVQFTGRLPAPATASLVLPAATALPRPVNVAPPAIAPPKSTLTGPASGPAWATPTPTVPTTGSQLYALRLAALQSGRLYTRLPLEPLPSTWATPNYRLTYDHWRGLLQREAATVARAQTFKPQENSQLGILLGDSLSLWFPSDRLPHSAAGSNPIWLNQSISGDTTRHVLRRLSDFAATRPRMVYLMAGINDLKNGATDAEVLGNLQRIITQLRRQHPTARIVVQSILPTRTAWLSGDRLSTINQRLAVLAQQPNMQFLDLTSTMAAADGNLHPDFTTDGLHLSPKGYAAWQAALQQAERQVARRN